LESKVPEDGAPATTIHCRTSCRITLVGDTLTFVRDGASQSYELDGIEKRKPEPTAQGEFTEITAAKRDGDKIVITRAIVPPGATDIAAKPTRWSMMLRDGKLIVEVLMPALSIAPGMPLSTVVTYRRDPAGR
jgi:hypothetical protein